MQTTDELSPRQAAEVFTALRFWARATRYNAEDAERALLSACESRSNRNWVLGAATGALAGLAVGLQLKQPRVQTASLAAIASTFGSLYGQYRASASIDPRYRVGRRASQTASAAIFRIVGSSVV